MQVEQAVVNEAVAKFKAGKHAGDRAKQLEALRELDWDMDDNDPSADYFLTQLGKLPEENLTEYFKLIPDLVEQMKLALTGKKKKI